jgi:hypothetical protein
MHWEINTGTIAQPDRSDTQLEAIRELMLNASLHDAWLTLGEIAEATEFGEASISAQLRHLRKSRHGRYRVEKRRRGTEHSGDPGEISSASCACGVWEYRVLPPAQAAWSVAQGEMRGQGSQREDSLARSEPERGPAEFSN